MKGPILLICYYFPPLGLAGVTRPLNLFKYLPRHGYDCHVLTVKPVAYRKYEPELLEGLDHSKIFRSGSRDPQRIMYLMGIREVNPRTIERGRQIGETMFPDSKVGWVAPAIRLGVKLHRQYNYRAIISTSPPIAAHLVGMGLAKQTNIPWVADFRDLWTGAPIERSYTKPKLVTRAQALLARFRTNARALTAVNRSVAAYVGARHVITNGYDPNLAAAWQPPADTLFAIGLLGTFSNTVPVAPLLKVLTKVRTENPDLFKRIRVLQVGNTDPTWLTPQLEEHGLTDKVQCHGLQSRPRTAELLSQTSLLYLGVDPNWPAFTTSRVYDMLASGRPLLAYTAPESELGQVVRRCPTSLCFDDSSLATAASFVTQLANQHLRGERIVTPRPAYAEPFSWECLSGEMARLLDDIV